MNALYVNISDEITLRKETLLTIKTLPIRYNFNEEDRAFFYAQAIPMIYAVWEGYIQKCFEKFIEHINNMSIETEKITETIIRFVAENTVKIQNYPKEDKEKFKYFNRLRAFFSQIIVNLPIQVDTESNLGFNITNKILETFGLDKFKEYIKLNNVPEVIRNTYFPSIPDPTYPLKSELGNKDEKTANNLLFLRNAITHGNMGDAIEYTQVIRFTFLVEFLMDEVFEKIKEGYEAQTYLKEEFRTPKTSL
jgi:hypothetical protein